MDSLTTIPVGIAVNFPGQLTQTALILNRSIPYADWEWVIYQISVMERGVQWWLGDALNYGERQYGETYSQALDATGLSYSALSDYKYVASRYGFSIRMENLSWSHHRVAAGLDEPLRSEYLQRAEDEGWSVAELSGRIANLQLSDKLLAKSALPSANVVSIMLSSVLEDLGRLPEETQQQIVSEILDKVGGDNDSSKNIEKALSGVKAQVTVWTGNNERYTPLQYIELARQVMGDIDVDPASNDHAQNQIQAHTYFKEEDNGLCQEWSGRVWLNPPYSNPEIGQFIEKLIEEYTEGRTTAAILLTNNSADTTWFDRASRYASALCFTKGRINFYDEKDETTQPTNGQTFFYFGQDAERFQKAFSQVGGIYQRIV